MLAPSAFDITAPLPGPGTTLLEASAGTGKTWTIGALVTRYVAEGAVRLEQMLVITFGRAASQELRQRVRDQLVEAERLLGDDPATAPSSDEVAQSPLLTLLLACDGDERARRHRRVLDALADFDAATIATTHQFCRQVLASLGVAGDTDARAELVEDLDQLRTEVVDDLYLRGFATSGNPVFGYRDALGIAARAVGDPQARLEPSDEMPGSVAARRVGFARLVRDEMALRKRRLGVLSYDDLLSQLAEALDADGQDTAARRRMRQRWHVVLVDEFQDTDPVQWQVLERAFGGTDAPATMVLIGDPKQAIYAFRGGDVDTYLAAAGTASTHQTLGTNRRSDAPLVAALDALLGGAELGHPDIAVHEVDAHERGSRLLGAPHGEPLRLRVVRDDDLVAGTSVGAVREVVATDLAHDVRHLLDAGATWNGEPLAAGHVAVLAHKHKRLAEVQAALRKVGVAAVIAGQGSVFATEAAMVWLTLLEALEQPHREMRVRAAALTPFLGHTAAQLDTDADADPADPDGEPRGDLTDRLADQVRGWARLFSRRGVAAVLEAATVSGLRARVLGQTGGERLLTDLEHIGEILHGVGLRERLGLVATVAWLREHIAEGRDARGEQRTRRLDSDAAAVQLVTIHASKGLQYPVVYLPDLYDRWPVEPTLPLFHDASGRRCLAVAQGASWEQTLERAQTEELGESLRLLYVALTRAQSQVVTWWAPTAKNTRTSALHRVLARLGDPRRPPQEPASVVEASAPVWRGDGVREQFRRWRERGALSPELLGQPPLATPSTDRERPSLGVRTLDREVDTTWRRTSYSALSHVEIATPATSEPETTPRDDEPDDAMVLRVADDASVDEPAREVASPMAGLPVGATFGSLVHAVLEHADPQAPDLASELRAHVTEQRGWWPVDGLDTDALVTALEAVCASPLGRLLPGRTLADLGLGDRLCELDFELPLAGGDTPVAGRGADEILLGDLAGLLRAHLPDGDPVRAYADQLDQPALGGQRLLGYLTGSVDVVLRVLGEAGEPRYVVVDYKTNWLGPRDEPLTAHAYRPAALEAAMAGSDYPLQALLYAVVLHRFLRWRQPGYDPDRHLGGVAYLYLRGMCGADTPVIDGEPCGVFSWRPPIALIEAVSDLLDGRHP
ncbi:UvrD-helicase domain-containing protein [Nocardioides sp. CBS4Y-1]|uniref:RecBCD enzyme subunit RecB n=1 Tax=Nocardioides acrostichi TaxID=2784339 RepID=A0A930V3T4_9ACTN|nr:UvrD-helicase domain-containing protein [Nocardioides acrostichi]